MSTISTFQTIQENAIVSSSSGPCQHCRNRKRGCDGQRPCALCVRLGKEDECVDATKPATRVTKRKSTTTTKIPCDHCRAAHRRCDGESPCGRCIHDGVECSLAVEARRRFLMEPALIFAQPETAAGVFGLELPAWWTMVDEENKIRGTCGGMSVCEEGLCGDYPQIVLTEEDGACLLPRPKAVLSVCPDFDKIKFLAYDKPEPMDCGLDDDDEGEDDDDYDLLPEPAKDDDDDNLFANLSLSEEFYPPKRVKYDDLWPELGEDDSVDAAWKILFDQFDRIDAALLVK